MTTRNLLADDSIFFSKLGKPRYQVKDERIILHGYNNEFLHDYSWYSYKYNRTARVMNMTILSKVNINKGDALVITHTYKRYGNEYKMFPMHYSYDWCQSLEEDVMISFSRESDCGIIACPIKKVI
ncbi:hypothetical protein FQR65_LT15909 [Abscondita terminalis]|nr:hypothetical protein FQR65_LT15909 [Abscondita terminalis]